MASIDKIYMTEVQMKEFALWLIDNANMRTGIRFQTDTKGEHSERYRNSILYGYW